MNHPFDSTEVEIVYFVHWSLWLFYSDETQMETNFAQFVVNESSAMRF